MTSKETKLHALLYSRNTSVSSMKRTQTRDTIPYIYAPAARLVSSTDMGTTQKREECSERLISVGL
jgi:hypothetical protein